MRIFHITLPLCRTQFLYCNRFLEKKQTIKRESNFLDLYQIPVKTNLSKMSKKPYLIETLIAATAEHWILALLWLRSSIWLTGCSRKYMLVSKLWFQLCGVMTASSEDTRSKHVAKIKSADWLRKSAES